MRDQPDALDLLKAARRAVLEGIAPALPAAEAASLVATALAIVIAEAEAGDAPLIEERAALAKFYEEGVASVEPLDDALLRLNRRLAADLRARRLSDPGPRRFAAGQLLKRVARAKLDEVAPDYPRGGPVQR